MNIVGFTGRAGAGKDTAAAALIQRGWVRIGLADPMKRACAEWFGWGTEALWGPSRMRAEPDAARNGLTPRHALQQLGTEFGRACWENVWVDMMIATARSVLSDDYSYDPRRGLERRGCVVCGEVRAEYRNGRCRDLPGSEHAWSGGATKRARGVVVTDVRFANEVAAIRAAGGRVFRLERGTALGGSAGAHASETEIDELEVDGVIYNGQGTVADLHALVLRMVR